MCHFRIVLYGVWSFYFLYFEWNLEYIVYCSMILVHFRVTQNYPVPQHLAWSWWLLRIVIFNRFLLEKLSKVNNWVNKGRKKGVAWMTGRRGNQAGPTVHWRHSTKQINNLQQHLLVWPASVSWQLTVLCGASALDISTTLWSQYCTSRPAGIDTY